MDAKLQIQRIYADARMPTRGSEEAAGLDLYAYSKSNEAVIIQKCDRKSIPCGIRMCVPHGYYMRIAPRSGLALRYGIDVLAGVIDSDYRGEIAVMLVNLGSHIFTVMPGDRIAQGIITPCMMWKPTEVEYLGASSRGTDGYGSTGR